MIQRHSRELMLRIQQDSNTPGSGGTGAGSQGSMAFVVLPPFLFAPKVHSWFNQRDG